MLNSKQIKLLSLTLFVAAAANSITVAYSWPYQKEDNKILGTRDFITNWNSLGAGKAAGKYFGLPVQLFSNGNGIVQVSTTFTDDTIDEIHVLLERIESISWAKLHKISINRLSDGNFVKVTAFFIT